jgi:molybdate transport system permease protein
MLDSSILIFSDMDWQAVWLSIKLALSTTLILIPLGILIARWLAWGRFRYRAFVEGLVMLPLVLPPTVLGFYLLAAFSQQGVLGHWFERWTGGSLAFSFTGLLIASLVFNLPFAVQPVHRAFEAISHEVREAAWCCGMAPWSSFRRVELPLARNGILGASLLTFAHTLGEFGVVLMVGGNIPGETRTLSIAIFDRVEAFDERGAAIMSLSMLVFSLLIVASVYALVGRAPARRD